MKYLLLCLCSCISLTLLAQKELTFHHISTGIKVGSEVGLLVLESNSKKSQTGLGFSHSVMVDFVEFRLNKKFGINLGIGYASRKYRQNTTDLYINDIKGKALVKEHLSIQNIEIPLSFRYYLPQKKSNYQVYLSAGNSLYFNLYHQAKQELFFKESTWEFNNQSDFSRTTFAAHMNIGFQFFTTYKISYYLEPTLQINPNKIHFRYGNTSNIFINIGVLAGVKF